MTNFDIQKWMKENGATALTFLGAGSMVATVALAIKATPKAHDKIVGAQINKAVGEELDPKQTDLPKLNLLETLKACWIDYIPTAMMGAASLACIFGANVLNKRQQAELAGAYAALEQLFQNYRKKADVICGEGMNRTISRAILQEEEEQKRDDPPWNEKQTFYFEYCGTPKFFERTMEEVLRAEYEINRYFRLNGDITLNEVLDIFGLEHVPEGDLVGWDEYIGETDYGYQWIDFDHRHYATDEGLIVCSIDMPFGPHSLDENAEE